MERRNALLWLFLTLILANRPALGAGMPAARSLTGEALLAAGTPLSGGDRLSEHERQYIEGLPPQQQAEELLRVAINHDEGATEMIMGKLESWRGKLNKTSTINTLEQVALYSSDLRVRAAMIEVDLISSRIQKDTESADRLIEDGRSTMQNRPYDAWELGMLANRGVEPDHIRDVLRQWVHDANEQSRFWAVEGLAHLGTEDTIPDFLEVLRSDPSMSVRERAGCSLAKSGMLTREQRMKAVPGLIEIAGDPAQDATTRLWAFEALREITGEPVGNDVAAWRNWFSAHGSERTRQFQQADRNRVLGNN
jgi:HEAT repeats